MRQISRVASSLCLVCAVVVAAARPVVAEDRVELLRVRIVAPWERVAGQTQAYWAQKWWNWAVNIRSDVNPNTERPSAKDPTGGKYASINNDGPIVFLPSSFGPVGPISRTLTVPPNRPVLVPILNAEFVSIPNAAPCPDPLTLSCALDLLKPIFDGASGLSLTVDGVRLSGEDVRQFRPTDAALSDLWINPFPDNIYAEQGIGTRDTFGYFHNRAAQDGYYVFLERLLPGRHKVRTTGTFGPPFNYTVDVTTIICVGVNTNVFEFCRE